MTGKPLIARATAGWDYRQRKVPVCAHRHVRSHWLAPALPEGAQGRDAGCGALDQA